MELKPQCSAYIAPLSQCDYGIKVGERPYYRGRMAYTVLHDYLHIVGVLPCLERFVDAEYWEFYHKHNGTAWGVSAAFAVGVAFLPLLI